MKIFNRLLSALLALCMVASAFVGVITITTDSHSHVHADETETPTEAPATEEEEELLGASVIRKEEYKTDAEKLATMSKVNANNELVPYISAYGYELYVQKDTGEVAVKNVATGKVLFTNPYDANQYVSSAASSASTSTTWEELVSQISIEYTDTKGAKKTLSSFKDAAEQGQITVTYVKNGISVNYVIGRADARRICPMSTTREFFETQVLDYIQDENDKKKLYPNLYVLYDSLSGEQPENVVKEWIERRPILAKMELYVLNEKATNVEKNRVEAVLKAWCPHITYETVDEQHTITEYVATASILPCFRMSLIYKLDENGLTVKLPANSIVFNEDHYTLKNITVLPYMGAGNTANGGFNFIPDGTGAIIDYKDIGTSSVLLTGSLYGADYAYHTLPTSFTGKSEIMRFPVFGVVEDKIVVEKYFLDDDNDPSNDIPYCTHSYEEVVTPPTCTKDGFTVATCTKCKEGTPGHQKTINPTPAAHTYDASVAGSIVTVPTNCQQIGKTTYTCTVDGCGHVEVVEDKELGAHTYVATPHPTELGVAVYTCTVCGDTYSVGHSGSDHKLESLGTLAAVCKPGVYAGLNASTYIYANKVLTLFVEPSNILKFQVGSTVTLANNAVGTVTAIDYNILTKEAIKALVDAAGGVFGMTVPSDLKRYAVTISIDTDLTSLLDANNAFKFDLEKKVTQGYTLKLCAGCGYIEKANVKDHDYKKDTNASVAAKCNEDGTLTDGKNVYVCSTEGCTASYEEVVKASHTWGDAGKPTGVYVSIVDGHVLTETEIGQAWVKRVEVLKFTCTTCKYEMSKTEEYRTAKCEKDLLGNDTHKYGPMVVVNEGDCTSYRKVQQTCFLCKHVDTVTSPNYSHKYQTTVVEATCTTRGYSDFLCTECGDNYRGDFVEPHHNYVESGVDYTCTTDGYTDYKCTDCGHEERVTLPAAHRFEETVVAPTCTEKGYTLLKCTECGHEVKENFVDAAHVWSKWIVTVDATKYDEGKRHHICTVCHLVEEEIVPAIGTGGLDYYEVQTVNPQGYVAIITEGESLATITSYHGASLHPYNSAYITINPRPSDTYNLADALSVGSDEPWTVVSERKYTGNYSIRYVMVSDDESSKYKANVSGMAAAYRDYLISTGVLTKIENTGSDIPLYIEALGATEVQTTFLSFPVYKMTALTTFGDLNTMITDLNEFGIENINFRLTGFANGGLYPTVSNKAEFEDVVGGNEGYSEFVSNANKNGVGVFTEFDFSYVHGTSLFDGYSDKDHALKTIDGRYNFKKEYNPTFQMFDRTNLLAISPSVFEGFYNKLSVALGELGYYGISSATLGSDLNSDFDTDDPHNREDSKRYIMEVLAKMKEDSKGNVMVDAGNAYTYAYANHILNMATSSSKYLASSESIPFLSMALHSYINYAGTPTNNASNINYEILKMIETGSNPYFLLCAQNTSALKENEELSKYYSIAYDIWMKNENTTTDTNIVDIYNRINEALSQVQYAEYVKYEAIFGERVIGDAERAEVDAANQEKLAELKKKYEDAEAAFTATVELYERLIKEGRLEVADTYFDNIGVRRLERNDAKVAYEEYAAKLATKPGYKDNGEYVTSDFTVIDNSIVYVEYANGVAFVLNYNNFAVSVEINGTETVVEPMDYVMLKVANK